MAYQNAGQTTMRAIDSKSMQFRGVAADSVSNGLYNKFTGAARDAAVSSTNAFLVSELEKRDPLIRQPLSNFTYAQNIGIRVGGGWVENTSNLNVDYGSAGDDDDANVSTGGATVAPTIQANFGKDPWKTHIFRQPVSIDEFDILRQKVTGRSLEQILIDGVRLHYDKHFDKNVFVGLSKYGTTGLLNNPNVTAAAVTEGAGAGNPTQWSLKTPDEILTDINDGINDTWARSGNDMSAIPNHILLPFAQYQWLVSHKVSEYADKSIMDFLMDNNVTNKFGSELVFGVSLWGAGAGACGKDRMAIYNMNERFVAVDELQPLTRMYSLHNPSTNTFDTNYAANMSEVELFYPQTISYYDGI
jgi:hypothetical protein